MSKSVSKENRTGFDAAVRKVVWSTVAICRSADTILLSFSFFVATPVLSLLFKQLCPSTFEAIEMRYTGE